MNDQLLIKPHPDGERLTVGELRQRLSEIEDQFTFRKEHGAEEMFLIWLIQERRMLQAELERRTRGPTPIPSIPSRLGGDTTEGGEVESIIWAKEVSPPGKGEEIETLWGPFLFPSSLHLLAGDAGLGKTTLLYNLCIRLARGEPFAGFIPPRPLRVLYYDLETPDLLFRQKLYLISENSPPEGLAFSRSFTVNGALALAKQHHFDFIILDTLNEAFDTREEEDNAEANRQMRDLRRIIKETRAAILGLSHMGKNPSSKGVYKLRGASARPAAADVVLNLEGASEEIVKLEVAKSRWIGGAASLYLRKVGEDIFEPTEPSGEETATGESLAEKLILSSVLIEPETIARKEILTIGSKQGHSQTTMERVLSRLVKLGRIKRPKRGFYCRPASLPSLQTLGADGSDGNRTAPLDPWDLEGKDDFTGTHS